MGEERKYDWFSERIWRLPLGFSLVHFFAKWKNPFSSSLLDPRHTWRLSRGQFALVVQYGSAPQFPAKEES